ncbi:hypothetical protein Tco_0147397, partial [Tanacetum coccineum]
MVVVVQRWWLDCGDGDGGDEVMRWLSSVKAAAVVEVIITATEPRWGSRSGRSE